MSLHSPRGWWGFSCCTLCARGFNKARKAEAEAGVALQTSGSRSIPAEQGKGSFNAPPCPPAGPHAPTGATQTHQVSKWPHPATSGRVRSHLKATQEYGTALPQLPTALGMGGTAQPLPTARSSPQVLLVEPPGGAVGEGAVRGAAFPHQGLAVTALHGPGGCRRC